MSFILVWAAMCAGNFAYQRFRYKDWKRATELTLVQGTAVFVAWLGTGGR